MVDSAKKQYTTTRIWTQTLRIIKLVAAMTGESMVKVMDRLARQELDTLNKDNVADSKDAMGCPEPASQNKE